MRTLAVVAMLVPAVILPDRAAAEDVVIVATGPEAQGRLRRTGEILDYTGQTLTLRTAAGAEAAIPADRVIEVHADWTAPHRRGDELFAEDRFAEALEQYREAARPETRPWVRRRLIAQAVWCYRYLDQPEYAAGAFLTLAKEDPHTPYFEAIPLAWTSAQPGAVFGNRLRTWLTSNDDLAALIAASWLLSTADRTDAEKKLRELSVHTDARIALLAEAQRWRTQLATAAAADVVRWRQTLERTPAPLRAGPCYLIGQAQVRLEAPPRGALTLLRVPVLYPQQRELAAEALLAAARQLEHHDRRDEALRLYRELAQDYRESRLVELAQQSVARLSQ